MSDESEQHQTVPLLPDNNDDDNQTDDSMFASTLLPATVDISLDGVDDDDDNNEPTFGAIPITSQVSTSTSQVVQPMKQLSIVDDDDDENPFGTTSSTDRTAFNSASSKSIPNDEPKRVASVNTPTISNDNDDELFGNNVKTSKTLPTMLPVQDVKPVLPITQETNSSSKISTFEASPLTSQLSSAATSLPKNILSETLKTIPSAPKRSTQYNIEITIGDPTKIGEVRSLFSFVYRTNDNNEEHRDHLLNIFSRAYHRT
jgi:hypothetical protein